MLGPAGVGIRSAQAQDAQTPVADGPHEEPDDRAVEDERFDEAESGDTPTDEPQTGDRAKSSEDGDEPDAAEASRVHPPVLREGTEASYPPDALAEGREARVVLRLTIDADGRVQQAEVAEPAGHGFDEAAVQAALSFLFEPATRDGVPLPARILYAYDFVLPPLEVPPLAPAPLPSPPPPDPRPQEISPGPPATHASEAPNGEPPLEVIVRGHSAANRLRRSAQAVHVIETEQAQRESADLGEVLARSQGIGVRRGGGLGSGTRFSLNGLTDDQIRFFVDGVPLELAGFPFGVANVPVNLVERVEVYRGVVPIRFGADALGGAVNLVSEDDVRGTHGSLSYQTGSFGTHRLAFGGRNLHERTGFFTRVSGFFDGADNDYPVDVEVPDERGRLSPARAHRFHDAYRALGGNVEAGYVNRPWARRLLLRAFATEYDKELQNNVVMTVPYGEVEYGRRSSGATLRYENSFAGRIAVDALAGYTFGRTSFVDAGDCVYDWFGQCVRERRQPGEIEARPRDQLLWEHTGFGRVNLGWLVHPDHALRVSVSPTYVTRTGDERRQTDPSARDPLNAERDLLTVVSGVEYEADLVDARLENITFVKQYAQSARSEEPLPGGVFRRRDRDTMRYGIGNSLRYEFIDWLYGKASYEWATRLPRPDEVFGDGVLVVANLELAPETSHNVNLGLTLDARDTPVGALRGDLNGFLREANQLIVLLGNDRVFSYQNVYGARSTGFEASAGWTSLGELLALDGNVTYLDFRNTASEGTFGDFAGDRIPNRPYLFANGSARLQFRDVSAPNDELALVWNTRYVHEFFRGWESVGLRQFKQVVPSQLLHGLALTYLVRGNPLALSFTGEVQNLTDQPAYDFFGVQRPGRAFYFKTTAEF